MKSRIHSTRGLKFLVALLIFLAGAFIMPATAQDSIATEAASAVAEATSEAVEAVAEATVAAPAEESSPVDPVAVGLNTLWVALGAMLVFFMQPGFSLVEAGFTRSKNTANILMKNFFDFMAGTLLFWALGYGVMFGVGSFAGTPNLFDIDFKDCMSEMGIPNYAFLIFQTVFCATAATIVSGAMAERTKFYMYMIYSVLISAVVYPISGHWTWGGGWLSTLEIGSYTGGFHDFAGSTIVHSVGGWMALVGAWILGPRIGKFSKDGKAHAIPGHNLTIAALGVFILWMGWFGFNPCSQLAIASVEDATASTLVFVNTNIAAAIGGLAALFISWIRYKKPSLSFTLNGILAGLVGITAGCDAVSPVGAAIIGLICGTLMIFVDGGLCYGGGTGMFLVQLTGAVVIGLWAAAMGFIIFFSLNKIHGLRVEKRIEEEGLDVYEHGESAYN